MEEEVGAAGQARCLFFEPGQVLNKGLLVHGYAPSSRHRATTARTSWVNRTPPQTARAA